MRSPTCCVAAICGATLLLVALVPTPARADGIGVARFLVFNRLDTTKPTWLGQKTAAFREYRHAKRDVKRLRAVSPQLDRTFDAAFKQAFNRRFSPERSTIFGFFAAVAQGNKAGRLAVIDGAKRAGLSISPKTAGYLQRNQTGCFSTACQP